ncbi:Glycerophosphoryl diester phosphodiesterase family domain-containing protein [Trichoderma austrokoningii]
MKFGLNYHQHLLAKWADDYVDYNGLRQMIRLASQRDELPTEVLKYLQQNIQNFEKSYSSKCSSITRRRAGFCAMLGLSEIDLCCSIHEDLLREIHDVEWFGRVNETAIAKILGKISNRFQRTSDYQRLQSQWSALQRGLDTLLVDAKKSISDIRRVSSMSRQAICSLYAREFIRMERIPETTHDWIKNDQIDAFRSYYFSGDHPLVIRQPQFARQIYGLFIAAVILNATEIAHFLLEFVAEQKRAMHTDQIFFFLNFCGHMLQNGSPTPEEWLVRLFNGPGAFTTGFLRQDDACGRFALHYAAIYGLKMFTEILIRCASYSDVESLGHVLSWRDDDGMTPLHYAVVSGETSVLTMLLKGLLNVKQPKIDTQPLLGDLLLLSVRSSQDNVANVLLNHRPNVNYTTPHGETALYCASQANNLGLVDLLLTYIQSGLDVNIAAATGWTPLMVACANGHGEVVSRLLEAGADSEKCDALGWTAREHAVFRGHLGIAELFTSTLTENTSGGPANSYRQAYEGFSQTSSSERLVVVNLGSTQGGHDRAAFELSHYNVDGALSSLVLEISAPGTEAEAKSVPLPVLEDQINQPFIFHAKHEESLQISVCLFRRENIDSMVLLSRGNTTLDHGKVFFGEKRESMIREVTVFMMDKETMDLTGTVLLSYVVATPFAGLQQPNMSNYQRRLGDPVQIVGHRGLGQNTDSRSYLQLGENTAMSFLSASKLGASFVEFDLQITRDLEAVIFHDFSLSESGTDVAIHDVTLSQYKHASDLQEPQSLTPATIDTMHGHRQRRRAWSTGEESRLRTVQLRDRLRYTVDFQNKGFKPNTRGDFIQGSLATLDELLLNLPEDIGFNIEMKYPRLHEAVDAGVAPVTIDINTFVDAALEKIQRMAGKRPIILSSFTPEVCILLSVKQKAYPVMFITNAGKVPMADKELRVASLQVGVQFARLWNLAGVVFACEALLSCPRLVRFVKNAGLVCASYGLLNNEPVHARVSLPLLSWRC